MDLINALPGNSSVNMNTGNNRRETVFYAVRVKQKHGVIGSLARQHSCKQASTTMRDGVFCGVRAKECYKFSSDLLVEDSHGKFVVVIGGGEQEHAVVVVGL
jgi:hypothetical protein